MMSGCVLKTRVAFMVVGVCLMTSCVQSEKRWGPSEDYYDFDEEIDKEIPCPEPGAIANGETIVWGDGLLLEYRCKASYSAVGITHGACDLSTGTWTIEPPVCVDGGCPPLTAPTHGVINLDTSGGLASFVCRPGYFLLGDSALVCEEGKWKGTYPLCAGTGKHNEKTKSRKDSSENTIVKNSVSQPDISIDDSDETCFYNQISPPDIDYAVVETNYVLNEIRQRYIMVATYTCMGGYKLRNATSKQLFCKNLIWTAQTLPECIADDDPCEIDNGGCHQYCTPHGGHKHSCSCYAGYNLEKDAKTCHDTDECSIDNGGCEHECLNTEGSFFCSCAAGFVPNGPHCVDIDECEKKENQCPGPCINSPGSFRCDCNITGFTTSQTTLDHCEDIDECANHNGGCDDVCNNKRGTFECRCETKGRKLGEDGRSCVDVDECSRYKSKVCVNGHCTNTDGSFTCTCNSGYRQARNLSSCEDVDECDANNGGCAQLCENKAGSFSCACHKGFNLADDNINCKDINECLAKNGGCDDVCVNKVGSYKCGCSHIGKVLSQDGRSCKECLRTQFFNRSTSACNSCPQHAHARDALALSVRDCRCDRGFHGNPSLSLECQDVNECQTGEMKCSHKCVNTVGSAHCTCPKGLSAEGDGVTCQDVDECELTTHNCSQLCYNSQGSYTCACQGGYILDKDGQNCNDIDECTKYTTLCSQNCTNTDGGYICACLPGYQLAEDGVTCEDLNECLQDESPCEQICTNTIGSFICSCDGIGFKLSRDQTTCIDINECMEGDNPCPNICINTIGSFLCDCDRPGYILASDASGCEDINECSSSPCPHACINTPGSYKCVCPAGFSDPPENNQTVCNECPHGTYRSKEDTSCRRCPPRTNTTSTGSRSIKACLCVSGYQSDPLGSGLCLDINECSIGALQCEHSCVNTEGSAHCTCKPGFLLDPNGVTCKDTNECAKHNGGCEHKCVNTPGSFYCECRGKNYKLAENGLSCEDVNECNLPNHGCEYRCINSLNGAKCTCPPGHELLEDGQKCKDIDECRSRNGGCTDTCVNTPGSYKCECKIPGFKLYTDNKQCVDRNECEEDKQACEDTCVNTPGSFKCHCRQNGFSLASDKRNCEDIDECAKGKICQQVCINLPGSFRCDCEAGYFKQGHHCTACAPGTYRGKKDSVISCQPCPSGMTTTGKATDSILGCFCPAGYHGNPETQDKCEDMNECIKNNGGCQHICNNTNGSFFCSCSEGYILQRDKRKCAPTRCPILNPPKFSKFIGKGCLKMGKGLHADPGTECMYQCRKYMMLHGPEKRTCLENFTWSGKDPECLARPCERLPVPENGYLYPPLCMLPRVPFRTRCIYKCNRDYESVGKPGAKCKANNKWSGKGQHHCVAKRRKRNG